MEKIFNKKPELFEGSSKIALGKWESFGPISISEIVEKSSMYLQELNSPDIEIKRIDFPDSYALGMHKRGTDQRHGLVRVILKDGRIEELMS